MHFFQNKRNNQPSQVTSNPGKQTEKHANRWFFLSFPLLLQFPSTALAHHVPFEEHYFLSTTFFVYLGGIVAALLLLAFIGRRILRKEEKALSRRG